MVSVGVIHNGTIIQQGSVDEVFKKPSNRFVARYAGIKNFFKVDISRHNGEVTGLTKNNVRFKLEGNVSLTSGLLILKGNSIKISRQKTVNSIHNNIQGKIIEIIPSEFGVEITIEAGDLFYLNLPASVYADQKYFEGENVWISFPESEIVLLN